MSEHQNHVQDDEECVHWTEVYDERTGLLTCHECEQIITLDDW